MIGVSAGAVYYAGEQMAGSQTSAPSSPGAETLTLSDDGGKDGAAAKKDDAKKRWTRETNALCRRAERETSRLKWPTTADKAEPVIERLGEIYGRYHKLLASLKPAKSDRAKVRKVLALFEKDERLIDEYVSSMGSGRSPMSFLDVLFRLTTTADKETAFLYELGARDCATAFAVPYPY